MGCVFETFLESQLIFFWREVGSCTAEEKTRMESVDLSAVSRSGIDDVPPQEVSSRSKEVVQNQEKSEEIKNQDESQTNSNKKHRNRRKNNKRSNQELDNAQNFSNLHQNPNKRRKIDKNPSSTRITDIPICRHYQMGKCKLGAACPFRHDDQSVINRKNELCKFFLAGSCTKTEEQCKFSHNKKMFPCRFFHLFGTCHNADDTCEFSHAPITEQQRAELTKASSFSESKHPEEDAYSIHNLHHSFQKVQDAPIFEAKKVSEVQIPIVVQPPQQDSKQFTVPFHNYNKKKEASWSGPSFESSLG